MKIDQLAWQAALAKPEEKTQAFFAIKQLAREKGIYLASINNFYLARGRGKLPLNFTVPAINLRGMTYDMAQSVFKAAVSKKVGALILEIARSEIGYTKQSPQEYAAVIMAAAIREDFQGPLFIQGDHFQVKKVGEIETVKKLIKEAIQAGFYNIDLDLSTLVDYSKKSIDKQQQTNYSLTVQLTEYIRSLEPNGIIISIGGEIGHIGGKNSTEKELRTYMRGFNKNLKKDLAGLSKISIQTGTHHGGVVLSDGSLAKVAVDFTTLKKLAQVAREYGMGGTVQHGASTLPDEFFIQFPKSEAIEVHLATGFQNMIMDHPLFPQNLLKKMYQWLDENLFDERQENQTNKQFYYKLRKKAWGPFKKECWELPEKIKKTFRADLAKRFAFLFKELNVENTQEIIAKFIKTPQ